MGAPDLLKHLRATGLILTLVDGSKILAAPRELLTDEHRIAIRADRANLLLALQSEARAAQISGNPLMTVGQSDHCHAGGWDDEEIGTFNAREAHFIGIGRLDAEHLAERLTLRDRDGDYLHLCLECARLDRRGRCLAAAAGQLPGADNRLEPVVTILMRCEAFELRKDLP